MNWPRIILDGLAMPLLFNAVAGLGFLLVVFWLPMIIIQFQAFSKELTPYPRKARWFNVLVGVIPALVLSVIFGSGTALGAGVGTMFLSFGNAFMFGGLLAMLPNQERFDAFEKRLMESEAI